MKKILISILAFSISSISLAGTNQFQMKNIPQPDFMSNDWDGDGEPNTTDIDDDGDGINDELDSEPFSFGGQSATSSPGGICKIAFENMLSADKYDTPAMGEVSITLNDDNLFDFGSVSDASNDNQTDNPYLVMEHARIDSTSAYTPNGFGYLSKLIPGNAGYWFANINYFESNPTPPNQILSFTFNEEQDVKNVSWLLGATGSPARTTTDFTLKTYDCSGDEIKSYPFANSIDI